MIAILVVAGVVAGLVGDIADTLAIGAIVILNGIVGFIQEYRSEHAIYALRDMAAPMARVRRDGVLQAVAASSLVPGDTVLLEAGDIIPADLRLVEAAALRTQEALLTGESAPIDKHVNVLSDDDASIAERNNMAFKGTAVVSGRALGVVVAVGMATEVGRIATLIATAEQIRTPLQQRLLRFGRVIAVAVLGICAVVFAIGLLRGEEPLLMFLTAVSLAVAAVPEALPAVVTMSLAIGARRMASENALVRHLPAIETLGSVSVIYTDKTGTLTQNEMLAERFAVGLALAPEPREGDPSWDLFWLGLCLANDATEDKSGALVGDPTETALVAAALRSGVHRAEASERYPRVDEIPFTSERRRMTTLHKWGSAASANPAVRAFMKGAPEEVIKRCSSIGNESIDPAVLIACADGMAKEGVRVMAIATREFSTPPAEISAEAIEHDFTFIGFVGLMDPPRPEARDAVMTCLSAGITPIMITGDHPDTASNIAVRVGLTGASTTAVLGRDLERMNDDELRTVLQTARVFARVAPEQKIRLVRAMQQVGRAVAMTGDGVNDAPALKQADVGVAMGGKGTEVAREAADLVLLDDNFATIVRAIREGRRIYDNIRKFIKFVLSGNLAESLVLLLAPFLGLPLPFLPIQILWINLITDGLPGLALATERAEPGVMARPPRDRSESIFAGGLWQHVLWMGPYIAVTCVIIQAVSLKMNSSHWQTMVFATLTFSQLAYVAAVRTSLPLFGRGARPTWAMASTLAVTFLLQIAAIYVPLFNAVLHTQPLTLGEVGICAVGVASILLAAELDKFRRRRSGARRLLQAPDR